ncbi:MULTISPECIES: hypothetical protein [Rhodococcus]|uniref:hypothetical protein n=1 Tax=Rhodococcus TaxID=1827 RepID=UPI001C5A4B94|nr:hypothetical protein [Rhodococcus sp. LW-XY12]QXU55589.1 hypothetical protein KXC42_10550 [Rhodococcus sp. LW-XY12]
MKLLIAPVTITPTKPLTPTHIKGFLWVDVLRKATSLIQEEVDCIWNPRTPNLSGQTIGFWNFLDRNHPTEDYSRLDEIDIGHLYVNYHAAGGSTPVSARDCYRNAIEEEGWSHPATVRMIELWSGQLDALGIEDPGLRADQRHTLSVDQIVGILEAEKLCLDHRSIGGPVYLDGTRWGVPLRIVIGTDGHPNYVITALRDIVPIVRDYDHVLLVHDDEITPDFVLLQKVIEHFGVTVSRLPLGRVPVDGRIQSSRRGGWAGSTLGELSTEALESVRLDEFRLGMRLYFTAVLGRGAGASLDRSILYRMMSRARRILGSADAGAIDMTPYVSDHLSANGWVDPYRLTSSLLGRGTPPARLIDTVYL